MLLNLFVYRIANAAVLAIASIGLALHFGAEAWSVIVLIQTAAAFLPVISLGYNEGFGLQLPFKKQLRSRLTPLFLLNIFLGFCILAPLYLAYLYLNFASYYLILPLALVGILSFSLMRIYFRSIGELEQLCRLYLSNSTFTALAAVAAISLSNPILFVILLHSAQLCSAIIALVRVHKAGNSESRFNLQGFFKFLLSMSAVGLPLLGAMLCVEAIMNADRLYISFQTGSSALSLAGVALTVSKGILMVLSVINVSYFKPMADLIASKNRPLMVLNLKRQVTMGIFAASVITLLSVAITESKSFQELFPSYRNVSTYLFWQGIYACIFALVVPLSTFSNLAFGGKKYLTGIAGTCAVSVACALITSHINAEISIFYAATCLALLGLATVLTHNAKTELIKWT